MAFVVVGLSVFQAAFYEVNILLRRFDALLGLLLEAMQHVNPILELHRVHCPLGVAIEVFDDLNEVGRGGFRQLAMHLRSGGDNTISS